MAPAINEDTVASIESKLVVVGGKTRQEYGTEHIKKASVSLPGNEVFTLYIRVC